MLLQFKRMGLMAGMLMVFGCTLALAQSITGDPVDLNFEIVNVTTGQPGSIERLQIQYSSTQISTILDIHPRGSQFDVPAVPIMERGKYIMTAWCQEVPYYWSLRGRHLLESPVKLHVYDTKSGVDDVAMIGLNLLIRQTESLLKLEYLLQVENTARPQVTLNGNPHVMIVLPRDLESATLTFGNGPEPEEIQLTGLSGGLIALPVPLTSGRNMVRLKATMAWQNGMEIPVGANVPIQEWSLMATPENLSIQAFDLENADSAEIPGYIRFKGPAIAADESFRFRVASSPSGGSEEDLFTQSTDDAAENEPKSTESEEEEDKGFPFVVLTPIFVVILVIVVSKRRQS